MDSLPTVWAICMQTVQVAGKISSLVGEMTSSLGEVSSYPLRMVSGQLVPGQLISYPS